MTKNYFWKVFDFEILNLKLCISEARKYKIHVHVGKIETWKFTDKSLAFTAIFLSLLISDYHIAVDIRNFEVTAFSSADDQFFSGLWVVVVSNKCSASTTESTIPFAKKFSWYKKKNMAHRRSIYKAKTNSFFEDNWRKLEFRGELFGESWFHNSIFQMQLVWLQIMPGICTPYWKNRAWIW